MRTGEIRMQRQLSQVGGVVVMAFSSYPLLLLFLESQIAFIYLS